MSRVEKILKVMLGRETKLPTPQSRVEELLIDLKTTYDSSSGAISGLDSRLTTAETNINNLQDDLDEEVLNLASSISDNENDIKKHSEAIKTLQDQVSAVQKPLIIKGRVDNTMSLPMPGTELELKTGWLYFVGPEGSEDGYEEYVFTDEMQWEYLGSTKIDLSNYVTETDLTNAEQQLVKKTVNLADIVTDLNDVKESGFYILPSASSVKNHPDQSGSAGFEQMIVSSNGDSLVQILFPFSKSNKFYVRVAHTLTDPEQPATWSEWSTFDSETIVTPEIEGVKEEVLEAVSALYATRTELSSGLNEKVNKSELASTDEVSAMINEVFITA